MRTTVMSVAAALLAASCGSSAAPGQSGAGGGNGGVGQGGGSGAAGAGLAGAGGGAGTGTATCLGLSSTGAPKLLYTPPAGATWAFAGSDDQGTLLAIDVNRSVRIVSATAGGTAQILLDDTAYQPTWAF